MELEWAKEWIARDMRFLTFMTDVRFLMDSAKSSTRQLREVIAQQK